MGIVTFALIVFSFAKGERFGIPAFVICSLLVASAAINGSGVGSIQPAHILLGALGAIVVMQRDHLHRILACLRFPNPGFWLILTLLYGVLGAIFIPRIAAGDFLVNAIGKSAYGTTIDQVPLGPTTGNYTQSIYFSSDLVCFLVCFAVASTQRGFRLLSLSLLAYCAADILLAVADLVTYQTGTTYLLDPIRNASYVIYVDTEATSSKRIIGSFSEASAFASASLGVFGFSASLWISGIRPYLTLSITLAILLLLLFSTSSTALVSLPFCFLFLFMTSLRSLSKTDAPINALLFVVFVPLVCCCFACAVMLHAPTYSALMDFLDSVVFNKASTGSGMSRAGVNVEAWANFRDSVGIGLGIGSVRAFSFVLAVAANLGVLGGATYAAFIGTALFGASDDRSGFQAAVRSAACVACLSLITASCVSGALIDLGLPFFCFAGLAASRRDKIEMLFPRAVLA